MVWAAAAVASLSLLSHWWVPSLVLLHWWWLAVSLLVAVMAIIIIKL